MPQDLGRLAAYGLLVVNGLVFFAWQYADVNRGETLRWMERNFLCSSSSPWHTLVTAAFSHRDALHLGINMYSLWHIVPPVVNIVGPLAAACVFLGGAVAGNACHKLYYTAAFPYSDVRGLGASGALFSFASLFFLSFPNGLYYQGAVVGLPNFAKILMLVYVAYGAFALASGKEDGLGHASHIGGAAAGVLATALLRGRTGPFRVG